MSELNTQSKYDGKWVDMFEVSLVKSSPIPNRIGKVKFTTPNTHYYMTREDYQALKKVILEAKI